MNELKTNKQRYWVALMLDDLAIGQVFEPGVLHITIIPWFVSDLTEAELLKSFNLELSGIKKTQIKIAEIAHFGPDHDIAVSLIEPNANIMELHKKALGWFDKITSRWAVRQPHIADEYRPHIRRRPGADFHQGQEFNINYIYLIAANRVEDNQRRVAAKLPLL